MEKLRIYLAGHSEETEYRKEAHQKYDTDFDMVDPLLLTWKKLDESNIAKDCYHIYIVTRDKKLILSSHIVVAYVMKCTWGTCMEIEFAHMNEIPVFLIDPTKEVRKDSWVKFHINKVFDSIDECFEHMKKNGGKE